MKKSILLKTLILLLFFSNVVYSQVVTTDPEFPLANQPVTIFFDATGTALEAYNGDVYTHTGITKNGSQWQNVIGTWGDNSTQPKLTKTGSNNYELEIEPSIWEFYGASQTDEITEMSFVFRAAEGSPQSADIFVDVFSDELALVIQEPKNSGFLIEQSDSISVSAISPLADSMCIFIEDDLFAAVAGISIEEKIPASMLGGLWNETWITVTAKNEGGGVEDSFSAIAIPESPVAELPDGTVDGINYINESTVVLSLYAPMKKFAFVIGDFNDWNPQEIAYMNKTSDGDRFWIQIENVVAGQEYAYQYYVDGSITISDPYAEKILDPWNDQYIPEENYPNLKPYPSGQEGLVAVFQTNQEEYDWQNDFTPPGTNDLVVYELLIRDFIAKQNYQTLIDTLNYLKNLGINAIELMPVNEFDGNNSWGYNPNHFLALDKMYGTKNDLKEFVDVCHGMGIAVILDVVYNHATNLSPYVRLYWNNNTNRPSEDSPFYNEEPTHDYNVFNDMNHESMASKTYISRAVKYWLEEYHVDGYRFDLSKGFTQNYTLGNPGAMAQYDQDRINTINAYADAAWSINPETYVILEHFADNSEEIALSNYGCMIWGNSNHNYNEGTMGYNEDGKSDFSWISYQDRGWDDPHVVGYMESHDEERLMAKNLAYGATNGDYSVKDLNIALKRIQLAGAFFFTIPGPKMIWQFGELGYDYNINYPGEIGGDEYRTDPKPIKWDYADEWNRKVVYNVFSELISLKVNEPAFETSDFDLNVANALKSIHLNHSSMNVAVLGNFDTEDGEINPKFQHTGMWYDYFAGDSLDVMDVNEKIALAPGKYRIYTDKKFARPEIGLAINDIEQGSVSALQVYPNPSKGDLSISFELTEKSKISLRVINMNGQLIRDLGEQDLQAGSHAYQWDGIAEDGKKILPGIYFCELIEDQHRSVAKIVVY